MPAQTHHLRIWMDKPPDISDHKWLTREKQSSGLLIDDLPSYGYFSMSLSKAVSATGFLSLERIQTGDAYTFVIHRMDQDSLDQQINRNLKRNIRDAAQEISITRDVEPKLFFDLCRNTYKRQRMAMPYSSDQFIKLDEAISKHHARR